MGTDVGRRFIYIMTNPSLKHESIHGIERNIGDPFLLLVVVNRDAECLGRLISVNHISPLSFSPVGEKLVTIVNDKPLTIK